MDISVVVPTYNRRQIVSRSLETLFHQSYSASAYEIVVVDDGSADGTAEALSALRPPCAFRVLKQENRGLAGARNTGLRTAQGKVVIFLDDDMQCDPDLIAAHAEPHDSDQRAVAFGAIFLTADSPPGLPAECFHRELGAYSRQDHKAGPADPATIPCVFGNASIRRELLLEFGGFDENFRMREDLELGIRLFAAGIRPWWVPRALARQYYAKTAADLVRDAESFAVSDFLLARKHPHLPVAGNTGMLRSEHPWKARLSRVAASSPAALDALLVPVCAAAEKFLQVDAVRNAGVRALQWRRRAHWLHRFMQLQSDASPSRDP